MGEAKTAYYMHREALCSASPFFETALKEAWDKGRLEIHLKEANIDDFDAVGAWIYKQSLPAYTRYPYDQNELDDDEFEAINLQLTAIYKFCDSMMMPLLQNTIVDEQVRMYRNRLWRPSFTGLMAFMEMDLAHTPYHNMMLRAFAEDMAGRGHESTQFGDDLQALIAHPDVAETAIRLLVAQKQARIPPLSHTDKCNFHIHPDGQKCRADVPLRRGLIVDDHIYQ